MASPVSPPGHGPGGHASEDALSPFVEEGYDHAVWGADVSLSALNLCDETLDGIRNHSWSRPAPATPEGEVVSWADRIAYVCHDWEDAVLAGIVAAHQLPPAVRSLCGERRSAQLGAFIAGVVSATLRSGCSEAYGSWKIICRWRRASRISQHPSSRWSSTISASCATPRWHCRALQRGAC